MDLNILPQKINLPEKNTGNTEASAVKKAKFSESGINRKDSVKKNDDESNISDFQKKIKELIEEKKPKSSLKELPDETKPDEATTDTEADKISINISLNDFIDKANTPEKISLEKEVQEIIPDSDSKIISISPERKITIIEEPVLNAGLTEKTKAPEAPIDGDESKTGKTPLLHTVDNVQTAKTDVTEEAPEFVKLNSSSKSKEAKSPEKTSDKTSNNEKELKTDNKLFDSLLKENEKLDAKNLSEFSGNNGKGKSDTDSSERKILKGSEGNQNVSKGQEFSLQPPGKIDTNHRILSQDKTNIYHAVSKQIEDSINTVLSSNRKEIKIDMSPPDLGSIKIEVITNKHKEVAISIVAKDVDIKTLIDSNKHELLNNMSDRGIFVKEFSVSVGGERNWNQKWRENLNRNPEKRFQSIDLPLSIDNIESLNREGAFISLDGKVNIYV